MVGRFGIVPSRLGPMGLCRGEWLARCSNATSSRGRTLVGRLSLTLLDHRAALDDGIDLQIGADHLDETFAQQGITPAGPEAVPSTRGVERQGETGGIRIENLGVLAQQNPRETAMGLDRREDIGPQAPDIGCAEMPGSTSSGDGSTAGHLIGTRLAVRSWSLLSRMGWPLLLRSIRRCRLGSGHGVPWLVPCSGFVAPGAEIFHRPRRLARGS